MTRRILAAFLAVLIAVIAAVIVPLGLTVTAQQRRDFVHVTQATGLTIAAFAEEDLGDKVAQGPLPQLLSRVTGPDDAAVIIDATDAIVAQTGVPLPAAELAAARAGTTVPQSGDDRIVVSTVVGDGEKPLGWVVLARSTAPLESRAQTMWLTLCAAALAAIVVGALVGWSLARWIGRPLKNLVGAARGIGAGVPTSRADDSAGPAQVRDVAAAFNDMADRIASLLEAQRGMIADVSHQLRTPLAALRLRLELLDQDPRGDLAGDVAAMQEETNRLSRLLDGLLAVARAESIVSAPEPTPIADLAAARVTAWAPVATERGISIELDPKPAVAAMTAGHLEQILDNLLANAIEAGPAGTRVAVTIHPEPPDVVLRVVDTGTGMTAGQRAQAFARFATDRGDHGGTGLGLAIVGRLVAADHGTATLQETPGGGLTAEVRLPACPTTASYPPSPS
ncbi:MAG: HAMP domain-containing histidine kinase [Actinomycetota bacterium]|nr:HAMP domain-containing histidine kinase [Actinomycetota bacterium]